MKITAAQREVLAQLPHDGSFGIPRSSRIHNGTLAALIRRGLIEWSGGSFTRIWQLSRGSFRLTEQGRDEEMP